MATLQIEPVACLRDNYAWLAYDTSEGVCAVVDPSEAGKWAREYYDIIKSEQCVPIGHAVNANIAMVAGLRPELQVSKMIVQ